ncbi:hypothetical protein CHOED_029 [Vibrio phage CHOED]|uniref:hypothetical protein n=1 Tax=Vibrio phage CHOED TaxID=1458716 RepID=UPI00042F677C|nr:hypothetical protein CHOED_029 [Vibrio phage CHOED]AHK11889.1 hypothetical protein CHOED_029 [Vibrio phage CHOED]
MLKTKLSYTQISPDGQMVWVLDTLNHATGMMCYYSTRPTARQIRRQQKAVTKNPWGNIVKHYDIRTGKFR